MMMRLGGADAFMLAMETPKAYMHTFKVSIIDPSTDPEGWSFQKFHDDFADRAHLIPHFRWKYADTPLGINHPIWIEDEDFNLDYHVRRVALPQPADHKALCEFMSAVYAYQLDRSRPLWKCWVVEGLEGGGRAVAAAAPTTGPGCCWRARWLRYCWRCAARRCCCRRWPQGAIAGGEIGGRI